MHARLAPLIAATLVLALSTRTLEAQETTAARRDPGVLRDALQERLDAFVEAGRVPGVSAGLVLADGTALALAAGVSERTSKRALQPDDRLQAGSVGKTFVAAVALQLVAAGELALDEPIGERLGAEPWFERLPNAPELTLRHLLSHRSGLPRYEFEPRFVRDLEAAPERVWKPAELIAYVLDAAPLCAAGAGFVYSDTNYILVGMLVEHATGTKLFEEIRRRLLSPLALAGIVPADRRVIPGLVQGYAGPRDPLGLPDEVLDAEGRFRINPQFEWAGGGFATTGGDLARWAHALYAGGVLDWPTRERMLAVDPAPELGLGVGYGLGVIVWPGEHGPAWGHSGFFPGYLSEVRFWPEQGVAVAVQVNTSEGRALPRPLTLLCEELLAQALVAHAR